MNECGIIWLDIRMGERYYSFKTSDGQIEVLTFAQASKLEDPLIRQRLIEIRDNLSNVRRIQDGFQPGWQENIQEYCGDRKQYDSALRSKGLVEIGNEKMPTIEKQHSCANEGFIQSIVEEGGSVSTAEEEAILSGEFFKDETIN
jgi:hypothetical protein